MNQPFEYDSDIDSVVSSTTIDETEPINNDEDIDNQQAEINNMWLNAIAEIEEDVSTISVSDIIHILHDKHECRYEYATDFHFYDGSIASENTKQIVGSIQPTDQLPYNLGYINEFEMPFSFLARTNVIVTKIELHIYNLHEIIKQELDLTGEMPTLTNVQFKCEIDIIKYQKLCLYNHITCLSNYIQQLLNL